ncbi:MAG: co-chaperone DjlA [Methylococcaceae bacterium]|nr:co-chaperone DjlA [Methylococcaceae bacterium]
MKWKGKILGGMAGFAMGGPVGAIFGSLIGHSIDNSSTNANFSFTVNNFANSEEKQRVQDAFFTATFSVMGHLAKADGIVSKAEINLANQVMTQMQLSPDMRTKAIHLFQEGKESDFPLTQTLNNFQQQCGSHKHLLYMFLEIQLQAALADGGMHSKEEALLLKICAQLAISSVQYQRIKRRLQAQQRFQQGYQKQQGNSRQPYQSRNKLKDAYEVLEVKSSNTDAEIKKSYRLLLSEHHPDKLLAKGLPEEMMTLAKEKTQEITKAYETIKEARKH